jgi:predicted DNA-binding transcriptional regulator AlpA
MAQRFPETGYVRLRQILGPEGPIPVGKSTWWAGVKSRRFPQPLKLTPRITVWRAEDILAIGTVARRSKATLRKAIEGRNRPP